MSMYRNRRNNMYQNINMTHLEELITREPEAKLIVDTLLENHMRIVGTISHEVRNPLTLLYGNMQLLQDELTQLSSHPLWLSALEDFQYTHELLNQLSLYNNSQTLHMSSIDTSDFFNNLALSFSHSLANTGINFSYSIPILPTITLDSLKIKSVIINLLKNAKEATTSNDSINFIVSTTDDKLNIIVQDTGAGISSEHMNDIFNPFISHKEGGTGLGLSICREIVLAHDGTIDVSSDLGIGTYFKIQLPLG